MKERRTKNTILKIKLKNMKRYISGIVAVIIAVAAFAFTSENKRISKLDTHDFFYFPPTLNPYSQTSVQDKANWKSTNGDPDDCTGSANKACMISVEDTYTRDSSGIRLFNTSAPFANIVATEGDGGSGAGYVPLQISSTGITGQVDKQ